MLSLIVLFSIPDEDIGFLGVANGTGILGKDMGLNTIVLSILVFGSLRLTDCYVWHFHI